MFEIGKSDFSVEAEFFFFYEKPEFKEEEGVYLETKTIGLSRLVDFVIVS